MTSLPRLPLVFSALSALAFAGCPSTPDTPVDAGPRDAPASLDARGSTDTPPRVDGGQTDAPAADAPGAIDAPSTSDAPSTGDAPTAASGDCDIDADCPGGTCIELTPGGYRVCQTPPVEATACGPDGFDACCTTADCTTGTCFLGPVIRSCGGAVRLPFNECVTDMCADDSDCTGGNICAPAGTFAAIAYCVAGSCHLDADCTAEAGGRCVVARDPCCAAPVGLVCTYASDGCSTSADCTGGAYCAIESGRARCVNDGGPICPL